MPERAVILYDDDCGFCKWVLDRILGWDRRGALRSTPIQGEEGGRILADMSETSRLESWHLALPSGEVLSAGAAIAPLADLLPAGSAIALIARRFPRLTERCYRFVADHRVRFGRLVGVDASCAVRR